MKRREFLSGLGALGIAVATPVAAQSRRIPVIGFLGASSAQGQAPWTAAFVQRLSELGWIDGKTVKIEYRWAEGRNYRFTEFAEEFVKLNVDVILTDGGATLAAKKVTSAIPIVFAVAADPLGGGYVASLSKPGGNVTGSSVQAFDTASKRLGLLAEVLPGARRSGLLVNTNYPAALAEAAQVEAAAQKARVEIVRAEVSRVDEIAPAIEGLKGRADGLYACTDSFFNSNRGIINTAATSARLPSIQGFREAAREGGFISYGANFPELFRRAAGTVDKILRGAKPGDLPVEQPTKFDIVVNMKTARALGIKVPPSLLVQADEVVE